LSPTSMIGRSSSGKTGHVVVMPSLSQTRRRMYSKTRRTKNTMRSLRRPRNLPMARAMMPVSRRVRHLKVIPREGGRRGAQKE
ncbi:Unknown protein, partial [Striga hermonthica]